MKKWLQKFLVSSVAVVTLGIITPSHAIWENLLTHSNAPKSQQYLSNVSPFTASAEEQSTYIEVTQPIDFKVEAKEQAYEKFGTKIGPKIQNEFEEIILPKIEEVIDVTLAAYDTQQLAITERPGGNYSEKIFNIYDDTTGKDIMRFHVRIENRPFEGYYYNFHYHLEQDQYMTHYDLGDIYWSKNTPPKWLS